MQKESLDMYGKLLFTLHHDGVLIPVAILLPIVSKIYGILVEVQTFNFDHALEIRDLTFSSTCKKCSSCQDTMCLCIFCGHSRKSTFDEYLKQLRRLRARSVRLENTTRVIVACIEDTFMSIIQLYIAIPLCIQYFEYTKQGRIDVEGAKAYIVLALSIVSILTSILSIASTLTKSYFDVSVNPYLGTISAARYLVFVSITLQVTSRLLSLQIFGLTYFEDKKVQLIVFDDLTSVSYKHLSAH